MSKVTQAQAEKVLEQVKVRFSAWFDNDEFGPKLIKGWEGYDTNAPFSIIWEDGPYDWTLGLNEATEEEFVMHAELLNEFGAVNDNIRTTPKVTKKVGVKGLYLEPIAGWALGIFPEWN